MYTHNKVLMYYPLKAQGVPTKYKCVIKYKFYNFFEVSIKEDNVKHIK